jgi:hypothetical protein
MRQSQITLFISHEKAAGYARKYLDAHPHMSSLTYRIVSAVMKADDGSVDRGVKCAIVTQQEEHCFYL